MYEFPDSFIFLLWAAAPWRLFKFFIIARAWKRGYQLIVC